ncbi:MAG: AraC family transcriptional regulator [Saprospiraceae bacterium]|nr:AraC family transcriptional regulator [Saprospiraceae bacterium]
MVNFIAIFGTLAFSHAIFLAVFFWRRQEGNGLSNRLLSFLLLALAVRITKSVVGIVIPGTGKYAPVLGVIGMVTIGPFLWLYIKSVLGRWSDWPQKQALHFIVPALYVVAYWILPRSATYYFYQAAVAHMFVYIMASVAQLYLYLPASGLEKPARQWMWMLTLAVAVIWTTFFIQLHIDSSQTYILITTCAALTLYILSFWGMTHMRVFSKAGYAKTAPDETQFMALAERITRLFETEKTYTDSSLNLNRLAERLDMPPYLLSKTINVVFQKSFPELLHDYRVSEAARRLLHPDFSHLSIEGIASESGFQSLSAFYTAFKKVHGVPPTEWKRQNPS